MKQQRLDTTINKPLSLFHNTLTFPPRLQTFPPNPDYYSPPQTKHILEKQHFKIITILIIDPLLHLRLEVPDQSIPATRACRSARAANIVTAAVPMPEPLFFKSLNSIIAPSHCSLFNTGTDDDPPGMHAWRESHHPFRIPPQCFSTTMGFFNVSGDSKELRSSVVGISKPVDGNCLHVGDGAKHPNTPTPAENCVGGDFSPEFPPLTLQLLFALR